MLVRPDLAKAIAWMLGALLSFTAMVVSVRELSVGMHAFEMLFIRSVIGIAVLMAIVSFRPWPHLRTGRIAGHLARNVIHFAGQVFWIFGIALLPLATVAAIEFTTPIWGGILAVLFLGERMNRGRWVAFALGVAGMISILQPGAGAVSSGALIMLACAFCFGATGTTTKWLTGSESALTIVFYMVLIQTALGGVASIFVWTPVRLGDWPMLFALALTGLSAHYCMSRALILADAILVMPMEFLRLPLTGLIGFLLYREGFEVATMIGAALIFSGSFYSLNHENRVARKIAN